MQEANNFQKVDIRVGKIVNVEDLPNPKHTTHKITIDFGEKIGMKQSGARLVRYTHEQLLGKLVLGVVNLPPKRIGAFTSEILTLGVPDKNDECILVIPDSEAPLGGQVY